jgi:hypothetical protein
MNAGQKLLTAKVASAMAVRTVRTVCNTTHSQTFFVFYFVFILLLFCNYF